MKKQIDNIDATYTPAYTSTKSVGGDLTQGPVMRSMLLFAIPMFLGNLLQQCYNIADTLIVGKVLGPDALAAVGSAFSLMTLLTSILLGLCMGSGTVFSIRFGEKDIEGMKRSMFASFMLITVLTVVLTATVFILLDEILHFLRIPEQIYPLIRQYLFIIFWGIPATFIYNYFASLLRAVGNSRTPLAFLAVSAILNIILDLWFVIGLDRQIAGAAEATIIAQYIAGLGIAAYTWIRFPELHIGIKHMKFSLKCVREIAEFSVMTCLQQSIMNFGILVIQSIVNGFGPTVMTAFAAAVKIDAFAYMPIQDFGNAFSTFIAQNFGAKNHQRIRAGLKGAVITSVSFSMLISLIVFILAPPLMLIFVDPSETEIILEGVKYLRIEGAFYFSIGILFLLYGLYRALAKPAMSVVLTIISLGSRVLIASLFSPIPSIGVKGIWWAIPIGWFLADATGLIYYMIKKKTLLP